MKIVDGHDNWKIDLNYAPTTNGDEHLAKDQAKGGEEILFSPSTPLEMEDVLIYELHGGERANEDPSSFNFKLNDIY